MNLKGRVERLESLIGVEEEDLPLILINVQDQSRNSQDEGILQMATIPGRPGGEQGYTLHRAEGEDQADFLARAEQQHKDFYAD